MTALTDTQTEGAVAPAASPFRLDDDETYRRWRDWKLRDYPTSTDALIVELRDPGALTAAEKQALLRVGRKTNIMLYAGPRGGARGKHVPRRLGGQFGLQRLDPNMLADEDGITSLQVVPGKLQRGYIPYSDKRLLWHTDGYYNAPERWIRAMLLHCVQPAARGGENRLLDHELVYLLMRDHNPAWVAALMRSDAMTIPANTEAEDGVREARSGPVFSVDPATGSLHMRYTARTRSIAWRDDPDTRAAVAWLEGLLASDSPYVFRHRLAPGQGVLCNNVLHNRAAFEDGPDRPRLIYRARYYDRIAGTGLNEIFR